MANLDSVNNWWNIPSEWQGLLLGLRKEVSALVLSALVGLGVASQEAQAIPVYSINWQTPIRTNPTNWNKALEIMANYYGITLDPSETLTLNKLNVDWGITKSSSLNTIDSSNSNLDLDPWFYNDGFQVLWNINTAVEFTDYNVTNTWNLVNLRAERINLYEIASTPWTWNYWLNSDYNLNNKASIECNFDINQAGDSSNVNCIIDDWIIQSDSIQSDSNTVPETPETLLTGLWLLHFFRRRFNKN